MRVEGMYSVSWMYMVPAHGMYVSSAAFCLIPLRQRLPLTQRPAILTRLIDPGNSLDLPVSSCPLQY